MNSCQKLIDKVETLQRFPERGRMIQKIQDPDIREVFLGSYRIARRIKRQPSQVEVARIWHGAQSEENSTHDLDFAIQLPAAAMPKILDRHAGRHYPSQTMLGQNKSIRTSARRRGWRVRCSKGNAGSAIPSSLGRRTWVSPALDLMLEGKLKPKTT